MSATTSSATIDSVEIEELAFGLCRLWMEEVYTPSRRNTDGFRGDYSETSAEFFNQCYSEDELFKIERFHRFLELRFDMIRRLQPDGKRLPVNDAWNQLAKDAGYLLHDLEPDFNLDRKYLEKIRGQLISNNSTHDGFPPPRE